MLYRTRFSVVGGFAFPVDMLRYDGCYPQTETDANRIAAAIRHEDRASKGEPINLERIHDGRDPNLTDARWRSFLWSIVPESVQTERR